MTSCIYHAARDDPLPVTSLGAMRSSPLPQPVVAENQHRQSCTAVNDTSKAVTVSSIYRHESTTGSDNRRRRRQLIVSLMDPEPTLVDYLVQNGVVTRPDAEWLGTETDRRQQNDRLLRAIESARKSTPEVVNSVTCDERSGNGEDAGASAGGLRLLTNALRQTGQHYLANLIDDSTRITGYRASGYLSRARHKGQVSVIIRVRSVRLPVECSWRQPVVELLGGVDRVGLDELRAAISSLERECRRAASESTVPDEADAYSMGRSSDWSDVNRNGIDTHRSKANAVVPPAPPPSPLAASTRPQSVSVTARGSGRRLAGRSLVRSLFCCCCCCGSEHSTKTKTVRCKQISGVNDNDEILCRSSSGNCNSGSPRRPSQLALNSEHPPEKNTFSSGPDSSGYVQLRSASTGNDELSGRPVNGVKENEMKQLMTGTKQGGIEQTECMTNVKSAIEFVQHQRAELYTSLISASVSTPTNEQEVTKGRGHPEHRNTPHPKSPSTVDQSRRTKLVMYLEQHRGVLVLDVDHFRCDGDQDDDSGGVVVACICTRRDQVDRMRRDLISGRLADDLGEALGHDRAEGRSANQGRVPAEPEVSFDVAIDVGELDVAQAELS